jgi:hypothetical protein
MAGAATTTPVCSTTSSRELRLDNGEPSLRCGDQPVRKVAKITQHLSSVSLIKLGSLDEVDPFSLGNNDVAVWDGELQSPKIVQVVPGPLLLGILVAESSELVGDVAGGNVPLQVRSAVLASKATRVVLPSWQRRWLR